MRLQEVFDDKYFLLGAQSLRPYIVINIYSTSRTIQFMVKMLSLIQFANVEKEREKRKKEKCECTKCS